MKACKKIIAAIAMTAVMICQAVLHADLATGNLGFTGLVSLDTSSAATATTVPLWAGAKTDAADGTFASAPYAIPNNTPVTFTGNWVFNSSNPTTNFWNVNGFKFELLSSFILIQGGTPGVNGFAVVNGSGVLSGNGFTPTAANWTFSISDPSIGGPNPMWTFRASIHCFNTNGAPVLASMTVSNTAVLSWTDPTFGLQAAPTVNGTFTNIPSATSPYTNSMTGTQQFFRLMQP
jgi:hypothetical protein